ncbi:MAG: tetratricopeptide repeat protein, partial [Myxococcota bacterium]
ADGERLRDEVFALRTQLTAVQASLGQLQETADGRLTKLSADVADLNGAARRNDADIGVQLEVLKGDFARVRGQVDALADRMSEVEGASAKTQEELDLRFKGLDEKAQIEAEQSAKARAAAEAVAQKRKALLSRPKAALNEAESLIEKGNPSGARELVRSLEIAQRKKKGWSVYEPKAFYLIGESYFAEGEFQKAAAAYNKVRKKYPKSKTWLPGSILKLGICFEKLGLNDDARLFYRTVSSKFPKHPAGREGRRLLSKLGGV